MMMSVLLLLAGLAALVVGAEGLVRGASRLALATGLSPLVVGLTVVGFGTSAPELAVGIDAVQRGSADIALGNVVGSNITNVLLILGISALVAPLVVSRQLVRIDVPVMIACSVLVLVLAMDGSIGRFEGAVMAAGAAAYLVLQVVIGRREARPDELEPVDEKPDATGWVLNVALLLGGLGLLVLGAGWLVDGAVDIAAALGLSELVIGLTVVAIGTSMPELATSVIATIRGERDMAVGNVVGSNILNLLAVLGLTAVFSPAGIPVGNSAIHFDLPVMLAAAVACLPIFFTGHCIQRWEGAVFAGYFIAYTAYLLLDSAGHGALQAFSAVMMNFVVPLTILTLAIVVTRALRERQQARRG